MKIGAVVRLKSGGPLMTVNGQINDDLLDVVWYDDCGQAISSKTLAAAALELSPVPEPELSPPLRKIGEGWAGFMAALKDARESTGLRKDIESAINRHSAENRSNTPDFILAEYLDSSLAAFNMATIACEMWHRDQQAVNDAETRIAQEVTSPLQPPITDQQTETEANPVSTVDDVLEEQELQTQPQPKKAKSEKPKEKK